MSRKEFIDKYFGKAISKTFFVFLLGTLFTAYKLLSGTEWLVLATIYIGSTKATETILKLKDKM
mgnify:CR=1 FL=1